MAQDNPAGRAILAAAKKHIADQPLQSFDVPEWPDAEGKPTRIWYRPSLTVNESFDIFRWKNETGDPRYSHAYAIIRRALDEKGNNLFNIGDEEALLASDAQVMLRVSAALVTRAKASERPQE